MNKGLWIAKKNQLCVLIKQVSDSFGGDEIEWLRDYARMAVEINYTHLEEAIDCYRSLMPSKKERPQAPKKPLKTNICNLCKYMPPFCYGHQEGVCSNS